jgi:hypothetical protein
MIRVGTGESIARAVGLELRAWRSGVEHLADLRPEFGAKAHGRLDARVRNEADDDESMNPVVLQLEVEIGVREAAGTPVLVGHDVAGLGLEPGVEFGTPRPVFKNLRPPRCLVVATNTPPPRQRPVDRI